MNNSASNKNNSLSSSDELPIFMSTHKVTDHEQHTGQSLPEIITYEKDDSSLKLVIKVTFHQKENTYREWYWNNAKTHLNMLMIMRFSTDSCTSYADQQSILNLHFHFGYFKSKRLKKSYLLFINQDLVLQNMNHVLPFLTCILDF